MKRRIVLSLLLLLIGSLAISAQEADVRTLFVGPLTVDCVGIGPQQCLLVKETPDADYQFFYDTISGFDFQPGYTYELRVAVETIENPPADASNLRWELVEIVSQARALAGNLWQLESYQNAEGEVVAVLPDSDITLELGMDQVGGSAGCNSYGGGYSLEGETLQFSELFSTMMYCAPEELMQQESAYLAALGTVASYRVTDHQLELLNADGAVVLTFQLVEPTPLVRTLWRMTQYNNGAGGLVNALEGSAVTAQFDTEGRVSGSAGCNSYSASYTASNGSLTISAAISTMMACPEPAGIMEQEQAYLAALENVTAYDMRGNVLTLKDSQGAVMVAYEASISGITWVWQSTEETGGAVSSVPNAEKYTLTFDAAGRVAVLADCNRGTGSYAIDGDTIQIGPLALTRAMCPPDSLSDAFVNHLSAVSAFELVDGQLRLSAGSDGQILIFAPAN